MELFRAEKVGEIESLSTRKCRVCNETLELVRATFDRTQGKIVYLFECRCGERIWSD
jgi:hypothetical protein